MTPLVGDRGAPFLPPPAPFERAPREEKRMKTLRDSLIAVLVLLAWGVVAHVADADLRERQRTLPAAPVAT
jgi:hypothetical protein